MPAVAFDRLATEVRALYEPPHRRKATFLKMDQALREFGTLSGVRKTTDITPVLIIRWLNGHQDRKPISNASLLSSFKAACNYAKKQGYLRVTPWEIRRDWIEVPEDDPDEPTIRHHPIADIARVLNLAADEASGGGWNEARLHALVNTYAFTGLRKMEALGLKIADIDMQARIIRIRSRRKRTLKTKASAQPVGIADDLVPVLETWLRRCGSDWVFPNKLGTNHWSGGKPGKKPLDEIKALGSRAGVPGLTILSFRHSIATHAARWGLGPLALKELLRHTFVTTQDHYREVDLANRVAAARCITYQSLNIV